MGRTIGVGCNFTIAPIKAAQQKLIAQFKENDPKTYASVLEAAKYVNPDDIRGLTAEKLKAHLKLVPSLSAEDRANIDRLPIEDSDTEMAAQLLEIMTEPQTTVTFSFEPYLELHFDAVDFYFIAPLAGFSGDDTEFAMGNLGFDMRFGHSFGTGVAFGISYGIQAWAPTATQAANALGLANLLWAPRYLSEYTTVSPYLVMGLDVSVVTIQANVNYNHMFGVKGDPDFDQVQFLQYGFSTSVTVIPALIISAELSGLYDLKDAPAFNTVYVTMGLRLISDIIEVGLGAQLPIIQDKNPSQYASFSNLSFGGPSDFNLIMSAAIGL